MVRVKRMTLPEFLSRLRKVAKTTRFYRSWGGDSLFSGMIRTETAAKFCPIEAVAGRRGAFTVGPRMGLSEAITSRIANAADGYYKDGYKLRSLRTRLNRATGVTI